MKKISGVNLSIRTYIQAFVILFCLLYYSCDFVKSDYLLKGKAHVYLGTRSYRLLKCDRTVLNLDLKVKVK